MNITIDYDLVKNNENYYNYVIEAINICNSSVGISQVIFKKFPFSEVKVLLSLIKQSTNTGEITFDSNLVYSRTTYDLKVTF